MGSEQQAGKPRPEEFVSGTHKPLGLEQENIDEIGTSEQEAALQETETFEQPTELEKDFFEETEAYRSLSSQIANAIVASELTRLTGEIASAERVEDITSTMARELNTALEQKRIELQETEAEDYVRYVQSARDIYEVNSELRMAEQAYKRKEVSGIGMDAIRSAAERQRAALQEIEANNYIAYIQSANDFYSIESELRTAENLHQRKEIGDAGIKAIRATAEGQRRMLRQIETKNCITYIQSAHDFYGIDSELRTAENLYQRKELDDIGMKAIQAAAESQRKILQDTEAEDYVGRIQSEVHEYEIDSWLRIAEQAYRRKELNDIGIETVRAAAAQQREKLEAAG